MKEDQKLPKSPPDDESSEHDTRQRILDAALAEFTEHGSGGARVDRIAKTAGVNKALLYYYFDSKQRLYEESLRTAFANLLTAINSGIEEGADLEAVLDSTAEQYLQVFLNRSEIPRLILRELANPDSALISRLAETIRESHVPMRLAECLSRGKAEGSVRDINERQAIVSFMTMQIGYFLMRPLVKRVFGLEDDRQFLIDRKDAVVDLFLYGVKAR